MAAATKRKAAKKGSQAKAGKARQAKAGNNDGKRAAGREQDAALIKQIKEMRADDKTHADIAKKLGIQQTKALFLDIVGNVKPSERLKKDDVDGPLVKRLRDDEGLAWHTISARVYASGDSLGIPAIKKLYAEAGGRHASGRSKAAKPPAKKAGKKKAARRRSSGN